MDWVTLLAIVAGCVATGAFAGLFAGMIGIGGGFTVVPVLNYLLPLAQVPDRQVMHVALATSLALMVANTASAAWYRWRNGDLSPPLFGLLAGPVMLGALGGAMAAGALTDWILRLCFIVFICLVLLRSLKRFIWPKPKPRKRPRGSGRLPATAIWTPYFFMTGVFGAMAGGGAATLTLPFMAARRYSMQEAAAQAAALSASIGLVGAAAYIVTGSGQAAMPPLSLGYLYLPALAGLIVGGQIGVPHGVRMAKGMSEGKLGAIFLSFLVVVLISMVAKALGA
ncbi:MAG: sulfite exporter TauE/SafE family protein [Kiloniellales bacterium]